LTKVISSIIIFSLLFPLSGEYRLYAQEITIYYGDDQLVQNCRVLSVSEFNVSVEYTPFIPGVYTRVNLNLASISGIRECRPSNQYLPCLTLMGSYIGVRYFMKKPIPRSEKTLSERFATWLDDPVNFISSVCVGGAVGYLIGHYLLGGNRALIVLDNLSSVEKQTILTKYIVRSRRL